MIALHGWDAGGVDVAGPDGALHRLTLPDLLALAREGRDPRSRQRLPGHLAPRGALAGCEAQGDDWRCRFADGSAITLAAADVDAALAPVTPPVPAQVWRGAMPPPPVHDYRAVMGQPAARLACLRQVLSHGYTRLSGVPSEPGTVATFLSSFGPVRETNYGRIFDVAVRSDPANLADSALALPPHTDNPYRASPPDLQALHTLSAMARGGESWLVDGLAVVEHLRAHDPAALALLACVPVRFAWADADWRLQAVEPVVSLHGDGSLRALRVNSRSLDRPVEPDADRRAAWWTAWGRLEDCLADPAFALTFAQGPGGMMLMDNRRVLHGRTAFTADGARHLQGAYADIDGLASTVLRLAQTLADDAVADLGTLFAAPAMGENYGEAMSIRDHMLQTAEGVAREGLGEEAVAAALLHDIGWTMAPPHERSGADRLQAVFGASVAEPVRQHVAAKRYLVARLPTYRDSLSPASLDTLSQQGGAMDEAECAAFEGIRDHALHLALRRADDAGKSAPPPASCWADYAPMLRRLALRHMLTSSVDPATGAPCHD